ncbi:MAG TPA: helix-turn-helix transcriptional regulator [Thermoanaerobaculia bacterium]|nr:helix-turn-helix transcriptional regulator [Thermoanaerobaculia bacterium]
MKSIYAPRYQLMLVRLKEARGAAGLTQETVARHFGRPQSFVSKCESGERRLDPTELWSLARLYQKPCSFFLDDDVE